MKPGVNETRREKELFYLQSSVPVMIRQTYALSTKQAIPVSDFAPGFKLFKARTKAMVSPCSRTKLPNVILLPLAPENSSAAFQRFRYLAVLVLGSRNEPKTMGVVGNMFQRRCGSLR